MREALGNHGFDLEDVFTFLHDQTGRPKDKIKWAFETKQGGLRKKLGCSLVKAAHQAMLRARTES